MDESLLILLAAFGLDLLLGDPVYPLHPVRVIGGLINVVEAGLERCGFRTLFGGIVLLASVPAAALGAYGAGLLLAGPFAVMLNLYLFYSFLAVKDLHRHGKAVLAALEGNNLPEARSAVQKMIGRKAQCLDRFGVARATVESLAENFIDGFLAPLFWYCAGTAWAKAFAVSPASGGIAALTVYKAVNTLDSMVGYRNERYEQFGKASARMDDLLNFIPARLGIPILTLSARLCGLDGRNAWNVGWRDRLKHRSPNAGHAEACAAGALGVKLNGPGFYPHGKVEKPWLGSGTDRVTTDHLRKTFRLILCAAVIAVPLFSLPILCL